MCGFIGFLDLGASQGREAMGLTIAAMTDAIAHRGPDDSGAYLEPDLGLAFGFRRLSILDLTKEGHQPMESSCGRYVIIFNGEIYNFQELKNELLLQGCVFRGGSDTEVVLAGVMQWGIADTVGRLAGMFAIAIWDKDAKELWLSRDRTGKKPLYYGWSDGCFLFGSELKGIKLWPGFNGRVDRTALSEYLRFGYVPAPHSIYSGIKKLVPGSILRLLRQAAKPGELPVPVRFWDLSEVAAQGSSKPFSGSAEEAISALDGILRAAVKTRMVADVPIGAFLSGGIDSSLIVGMMQSMSDQPIKTFSIGFKEGDFNEAIFAAKVAQHLGTEHTECYVTPADAMEVIPTLATIYDEPFSDPSQIPTLLVSKLARCQVTVVLSGDGGDEVFGGYDRYAWASRIWPAIRWIPNFVRVAMRVGLQAIPVSVWDFVLRSSRKGAPAHAAKPGALTGDRIHKLADKIVASSFEDFYRNFVSIEEHPEHLLIGSVPSENGAWPPLAFIESPFRKMMCLDTLTNLPDDILVKVDRATMAFSLEARVPLLDHGVIEWAWTLPISLIFNDGKGKWLLRELLKKYVPRSLFDRPKQGFSVPLREWLRGPLRAWAEDLLDPARLKQEGNFNPEVVQIIWTEHIECRRNWTDKLWTILMFQAWFRNEKNPSN